MLTAVILPDLPNQTFGPFGFNPFKTWLIVVAASGISYGSYLLQKVEKGQRRDVGFRGARRDLTPRRRRRSCWPSGRGSRDAPHLYAGGILMASGVMYLRIAGSGGAIRLALDEAAAVSFLLVGGAGLLGRAGCGRAAPMRRQARRERASQTRIRWNYRRHFYLRCMFVILLAATHYAIAYLGRGGVYGLAALTGLSDITPFVLGLTQPGTATPLGRGGGRRL